MRGTGPRRGWIAAAVACLAFAPLAACPFCAKLGKTVSEMVAEADAVVFGRFGPDPANATRVEFDLVVKAPTGFPAGAVPIGNAVSVAGAEPRLVFLKRRGGQYVVTKASKQANRATAEYLAGLGKYATRRDRIAAQFARLMDPEPEIADDAYKSIAKLYAAELAAERAVLDPAALRRWLQRDDLRPERAGLLALLLGLCGGPADAALLAELADRPPPRLRAAQDGLLGGLAALDFERGAALALKKLNDAAALPAERDAGRSALAFALAELPRVDPAPWLAQALPTAADDRFAADLLILFRQHEFAGAEGLALRLLAAGKPPARVSAARFLAARTTPAARAALVTFRRTEPALAAEAAQTPPSAPPPPRVARR